MSTIAKIAGFVLGGLAIAPFVASAADTNFPRHGDPGSVDRIVIAAMNSVEISKRALIDYGTYDQKNDPAKTLILQIAARGHNMQRQTTPGPGPMYSMRFIMDRVKRIEDQVIRNFQKKRSIHCVATDDNRYEAVSGTTDREASTFCLPRPDWKRYETEPGVAVFETEVGSTAQ